MRTSEYLEKANGKVNLGLAVLTRRGDGFHEVETVLAQLELADDLRVVVSERTPGTEQVRVSVLTPSGEPPALGADSLPAGPENLVHVAASAYLARLAAVTAARPGANASPGVPDLAVHVELVKRLPVAAGLGGGSSDAAAVLRALQRAHALGQGAAGPLVTEGELERLALTLGSDVPFFLAGSPAALARGRGEKLSPLRVPRLDLVLVNPGFGVSAASAYAELVGFTPRLRFERALGRLSEGLDPGWSNGLQPGVLRAQPELRDVLKVMREAGLKGVLMSGSGATCFGVAASAEEAVAVARSLAEAQPGWWTVASATLT